MKETFNLTMPDCFQTTYEELKPNASQTIYLIPKSFQTTYEELKHQLFADAIREAVDASRLPMRN